MSDPLQVERWESDLRRWLDKAPDKRLSTLAGLRAAWRKPTAADGMYAPDVARFNPLCGPAGQLYSEALDRLEREFSKNGAK